MSVFSGMPAVNVMPPPYNPFKGRQAERQYERLTELEDEFADLSVEVDWSDDLTAEQEEAMRERMEHLRTEIEEIKEELGID